jgi:hypothetical protein
MECGSDAGEEALWRKRAWLGALLGGVALHIAVVAAGLASVAKQRSIHDGRWTASGFAEHHSEREGWYEKTGYHYYCQRNHLGIRDDHMLYGLERH